MNSNESETVSKPAALTPAVTHRVTNGGAGSGTNGGGSNGSLNGTPKDTSSNGDHSTSTNSGVGGAPQRERGSWGGSRGGGGRDFGGSGDRFGDRGDRAKAGPMEVVVEHNIEKAMKVLKRKLIKEGLFKELKLRRYFEKPSEKKKRKSKEAMKKARKEAARNNKNPFMA